MNYQPVWERSMRRRLRLKAKSVGPKYHLDVKSMIALTFFGACVIAVCSMAAEKDEERMVAVTLVTGVHGTVLGRILRARWQDGVWFASYAPVNNREIKSLETRAALPNLIRWSGMGLMMAVLGCLAGFPSAMVKAMPVAASAMVIGMVFSSGRWGKIMLWVSGVGSTGWTFAEMMNQDLRHGSIAIGFLQGWLPAFPLSLWAGDAALLIPRLTVFVAAVAVIFFEWRKVWRGVDLPVEWSPQGQENPSDLPDADAEPIEAHETEDPRPALRDDVRATVTRGWVGLAGYLRFNQIGWLDRLLWKYMVPRQRLLSCLGIYGTSCWLRRVKIASILLAVSVALFWTMRLSMENYLGAMMTARGEMLVFPAIGIAFFAFAFSSPGSNSTFEPWTKPFKPGFQRSIAPLAIFPISPSEWARCAAREWQVRAIFVALIWSVATVAVALGFFTELSVRNLFGWFVAPWCWLAAMLPFSVGGRLLRAHYGRAQGFILGTRLLLPLALMAISPAAIVVVIIGFALRHFPTYAGGITVAAVAGWAGLRLAVASCGNMRADIAYDATEKPQG